MTTDWIRLLNAASETTRGIAIGSQKCKLRHQRSSTPLKMARINAIKKFHVRKLIDFSEFTFICDFVFVGDNDTSAESVCVLERFSCVMCELSYTRFEPFPFTQDVRLSIPIGSVLCVRKHEQRRYSEIQCSEMTMRACACDLNWMLGHTVSVPLTINLIYNIKWKRRTQRISINTSISPARKCMRWWWFKTKKCLRAQFLPLLLISHLTPVIPYCW